MNHVRVVLACAMALLPPAAVASPRDEPPPRAKPQRGCDPGFVAVADTRTCVKVSGRVRAEFVTGRASRLGGPIRSQGRVDLETRTRTEYGTLRAVVRVQGGRDGF